MSPTIPILFALLLSLMSGSTGGGSRMDSVALLRKTLRYWRKLYKTYHQEVMLGYCWADYLLEISDELSANLSAMPGANASIGAATRSQRGSFPQDLMTRATSPLRSRQERSRPIILRRFVNPDDPDEYAARSRIITDRQRWTTTLPPTIRPNDRERRHDAPTTSHQVSRGFSSRRTSAINSPTRNDDENNSGSTDLVKGDEEEEEEEKRRENTRRKALRSPTRPNRHRVGSLEAALLRQRSFSRFQASRERGRRSLERDSRRFSSRRWPRERNPEGGEPLSDLWRMPEVDRGMRRNPEERRVPLSGDGGIPTPSRLQFRWVNTDCRRRRRRAGVVKLMDSERNSSRDPARAINSRTSRRKPEELSRDSLLSPRGGGTARRTSLESRTRMAVKKTAFPPAETTGGASKRRSRRSGEQQEESRTGSIVPLPVPVVVTCTFCNSGSEKQQTLRGEEALLVAAIPRQSRQRDERTVGSAALLDLEQLADERNYDDSTSRPVCNSRPGASRNPRGRQYLVQQSSPVSTIRSIVVAVFRTLGMFVQVGRQIMDVVESNTALACTKEYLWIKIIQWIDA